MTSTQLTHDQENLQIPPKPPDYPQKPLESFKSKLLASKLLSDKQMKDCVDINEGCSPEV